MDKLVDWILIPFVIILLALVIVMVYTEIKFRGSMNAMIEKIEAEGYKVSESSVSKDTLDPWCEMYYYGENGVRIKDKIRGIDTIVTQNLNVTIDNPNKKIIKHETDTTAF